MAKYCLLMPKQFCKSCFLIKKACLTLRTKIYEVFITLIDQLMKVILLKLFFMSVIKLIISFFLSLAKYYELIMLKQFCKSCFFNYKSSARPWGQKYNVINELTSFQKWKDFCIEINIFVKKCQNLTSKVNFLCQ